VGLIAFIAYAVHRVMHWKEPWVHKLQDVDLASGLDKVEALCVEDVEGEWKTKKPKFWRILSALWD
jgi:hypothetical protein